VGQAFLPAICGGLESPPHKGEGFEDPRICPEFAGGFQMISEVNREVFNQLSYGLYIVTSRNEARLNGQIVNTVLQVTADPPRVAVVINKKNLTHEFIMDSRVFGASVLDDSTPLTFIGLFGFRTGRDADKLSQVSFIEGVTGCPLVTDHSLSVLEARVIETVDVGTHMLFVGDVLACDVLRSGQPLTYHYYQTHLKGKASKQSPTYNPDKK
jgi:ferric-chelate reductase [NAD(P)H]